MGKINLVEFKIIFKSILIRPDGPTGKSDEPNSFCHLDLKVNLLLPPPPSHPKTSTQIKVYVYKIYYWSSLKLNLAKLSANL